MFKKKTCLIVSATLAGAVLPGVAYAQSADADSFLAMGAPELRGEMQSRYDAALALSQDQSVVAADSNRFMWASQAKVQCGIAIGYLKSGYKDPVSVGKCVDAHMRMQNVPPPPPPPSAMVPQQMCDQPVAGIVFFEWDSAVPPADASSTIDSTVANMTNCKWSSISVVGHADRSGSDSYNEGLSARRARAVADLLQAKGISAQQMNVSSMGERANRVPTEDGVREVQNRRVEISVN